MLPKLKIVNSMEEFNGLMETLERYGFRWACDLEPTEANFLTKHDFPIEIWFGGFGLPSKTITWSPAV